MKLNDYKKNKSKYFASKSINLHLTNNMPWFEKYEILLNSKKKYVRGNICKLMLSDGRNDIVVRGINSQGIMGPPSRVTINYDSNYPNVKSFW